MNKHRGYLTWRLKHVGYFALMNRHKDHLAWLIKHIGYFALLIERWNYFPLAD